jgi:hypothetical protein
MDDDRIRKLTEDVFRKLRAPARPDELEHRVAALESAVQDLRQDSAPLRGRHAAAQHSQVSGQILTMLGSACDDGCVLEPGKPCTGSGRCKTFGH